MNENNNKSVVYFAQQKCSLAALDNAFHNAAVGRDASLAVPEPCAAPVFVCWAGAGPGNAPSKVEHRIKSKEGADMAGLPLRPDAGFRVRPVGLEPA